MIDEERLLQEALRLERESVAAAVGRDFKRSDALEEAARGLRLTIRLARKWIAEDAERFRVMKI